MPLQLQCDTGVVFVTRVWRESKVIGLLSIIHSGIILDLVCGFGGSVGEDVRADFFPLRREIFFPFIHGCTNEKW